MCISLCLSVRLLWHDSSPKHNRISFFLFLRQLETIKMMQIRFIHTYHTKHYLFLLLIHCFEYDLLWILTFIQDFIKNNDYIVYNWWLICCLQTKSDWLKVAMTLTLHICTYWLYTVKPKFKLSLTGLTYWIHYNWFDRISFSNIKYSEIPRSAIHMYCHIHEPLQTQACTQQTS